MNTIKKSSDPSLAKYEYKAPSISINLLPRELILERLQSSKLAIISRLSFLFLLLLIFFSAATLALKVSQNSEYEKTQQGLVLAQNQLLGLQTKELQVSVLKQRLTSIQALEGGDLKRKAIFNVLVSLIPPSFKVSEFAVEGNGNVTLTLSSSSLNEIDAFLSDLGDKGQNGDLISKVVLDGISLGKDSTYRFKINILMK